MKSFKTESQKVLDIMINSIYTNKEIFLRELISNGSDAIDKLYFHGLNGGISGLNRDDFYIKVSADKDARTLTVEDNGIGMTAEELDKNLGTIAKSDSQLFKENNKDDAIDIIGQFGVGFYSAFMVSEKVEVYSRKFDSEKGAKWSSKGTEGYTVASCDKAERGTKIVLTLKPDTEGENYGRFLEEYQLRSLIKKYSDYIRYPVQLLVTHTHYDDEGKETESHTEYETVNTMLPLWKKNKSEITEQMYNEFYKEVFRDEDPLAVIHTSAEGTLEYKALLYIPSRAPYNYYTRDYEKGLKLYTDGVLISDKTSDLLPDYFGFVKGLVDCQLTLNISRETVQQNRQLKLIASNIEKKIAQKLADMLKNDREKYEKFFNEFGLQIKYGMYSDFGMHKEQLKDLVLLYSVKQDKLVTFAEYIENMQEGQDAVYYATGSSRDAIKMLPQCSKALSKGFDVLCLTDDVDEFALKVLDKYADKPFKSVSEQTTSDKGEQDDLQDKDMLEFIKTALDGEVSEVHGTDDLEGHPVCLTSVGDLSIEMEKVLGSMPNADGSVKAQKALEINRKHAIYGKLKDWYISDKDKLADVSKVLYQQARLIEGLTVENPTELASLIFKYLAQ
ncbi:MAG: molecular chaperone HtpG [Corallococcus sp.]|nr:molecular chaperone HtpG [Corallococcus sp.]